MVRFNQALILGYFNDGNVYGDPTPMEVSAASDHLNEYFTKSIVTAEERDAATESLLVVMAHAAKVKEVASPTKKNKRGA